MGTSFFACFVRTIDRPFKPFKWRSNEVNVKGEKKKKSMSRQPYVNYRLDSHNSSQKIRRKRRIYDV